MSEKTNPSVELLKALEAEPATKGRKISPKNIPPMPKEVSERLKEAKPVSTVKEESQLLPEVDQNDKLAFIAHMMGAPRFSKSYTLYGGALNIVFRTLTAEEDEACVKAATAKVPDPVLRNVPENEHLSMLQTAATERIRVYQEYKMIVSMKSVQRQGTLVELPDVTDLAEAYESFISTSAQPFLATVRYISNRFETLVNTMLALSETPDFWKAVSQA